MKSTKKLISILIALMLVLGYSLPVFAAGVQTVGVTATLDKTSVKTGESITLSLSFDQAVEDVSSFTFYVGYDESLFTYDTAASAMPADYYANCNQNPYTISYQEQKYATNIAKFGFMHSSTVAAAFDGTDDYAAGVFYNMVFVAKSDITEVSTANFNLNASGTAMLTYTLENGTLGSITNKANLTVNGVEAGAGGDANSKTVTISPNTVPPTPSEGYTAGITAAADSYNSGENAYINLNVSDAFAAAEIILTYDPAVLTFNKSASTLDSFVKVDETSTAGRLVLGRAGETVTINESAAEYVLAFAINADTTAESTTVSLADAWFSEAQNAGTNLTHATISPQEAVVNIKPVYAVTLPEEFTGDATVRKGADYTFEAKDKNYNYTFTGSTMGGNPVSVTDNGDGTFTVTGVTGPLVIQTQKTGKTQNVNVSAAENVTVSAPTTAAYGTDYVMTIAKEEGFNYPVSVTIGGTPYTNFTTTTSEDGTTITVTIPGNAITGEIGISVGREETQAAVTINGASGDVNAPAKADLNQSYTFTVTKTEGYDYTVEIKVNGTVLGSSDYDVTSNGNVDTYTIHADKVTGPITINVTKTAHLDVGVHEYVTLNGTQMFLVTVKGTPGEGYIYTYDGNAMYWSDEYDAYSYLVITGGTLSPEAAAEKVSTSQATAVKIDYDAKDVNKSDYMDANDAQMVYNMYSADYSDFSTVNMEMFLRADVNGDMVVDTKDVDMIINFIIANR